MIISPTQTIYLQQNMIYSVSPHVEIRLRTDRKHYENRAKHCLFPAAFVTQSDIYVLYVKGIFLFLNSSLYLCTTYSI